MAIKFNGKSYDISVVRKSSIFKGIKVERERTDIKSDKEAQRIEKRLINEAQRELFKREQLGSTWGKVVDDYEMALRTGEGLPKPVTKGTEQDYMQILRKYTKRWGVRPAASVSTFEVRQLIDEAKAEGISLSRLKKVKNVISGVFKFGIETGRIRGLHQSPCLGVSLGRIEQKKPTVLNRTEIAKLLETARNYEHPWFPVWAVAIHTGLRNNEIFALRWSDIDFESRKVSVTRSYNRRIKGFKPPKSDDWREVWVNDELMEVIEELRAGPEKEFVLPRLPGWERGEQARILRQFCQSIGLTPVRFHELRACFTTQLLRDNVAPLTVQKLGGWKDIKTMQKYIRLAGIEIENSTDSLKFLTPKEASARVFELFRNEG